MIETDAEQLLVQQWQEFNRVSKLSVSGNPLLERIAAGNPELPQGTLLHGTTYSPETIKAIKATGILSGEFVGVPEDSETHYCADFFRVPHDMTLKKYQAWITEMEDITGSRIKKQRMERSRLATPLSRNKQITFIVDSRQTEIAGLLQQDAYDEGADPKLRAIVNDQALLDPHGDKQTRRLSAILCGVPSNAINGIVVSSELTEQETELLWNTFGSNVALFSAKGELILPLPSSSSQ